MCLKRDVDKPVTTDYVNRGQLLTSRNADVRVIAGLSDEPSGRKNLVYVERRNNQKFRHGL
jgi:hypothetical protein